MSESQVNAILSPRKRVKKPPKWVLPVAIAVMLVILVAVIYMANYWINQKPQQESQAISWLPRSSSLVDVGGSHWRRVGPGVLRLPAVWA